jgi:hypothetical protein
MTALRLQDLFFRPLGEEEADAGEKEIGAPVSPVAKPYLQYGSPRVLNPLLSSDDDYIDAENDAFGSDNCRGSDKESIENDRASIEYFSSRANNSSTASESQLKRAEREERIEQLLANALLYAHVTNPNLLTIYKSEAIEMYKNAMSRGVQHPDWRSDSLTSASSRHFFHKSCMLVLSYLSLTVDSKLFDLACDTILFVIGIIYLALGDTFSEHFTLFCVFVTILWAEVMVKMFVKGQFRYFKSQFRYQVSLLP